MRPRPMTPLPAAAPSRNRLNWADVVVAGMIFVIAGLLIMPAVNGIRFQYRVTACKENLHQVGQSLAEYSRKNCELYPVVPMEGNTAAAGIYAPILAQDGYLTEPQRLICPDSNLAQQQDFRVPGLDEVRAAAGQELARLRQTMGGSYGYCLGYIENGVYQPTRNLNRNYFAIMADAPSQDRLDHQSPNHGWLGQNVLFGDTHVAFCSTTFSGGDNFYTNNEGQVAPGCDSNDSVIVTSDTAPWANAGVP